MTRAARPLLSCESVQLKLAHDGIQALKDDTELQAHVGECGECFDFIGSLERLDQAFEQLPEHNAPDNLVQRTLEAAQASSVLADDPPKRSRRIPAAILRSITLKRAAVGAATLAVAVLLTIRTEKSAPFAVVGGEMRQASAPDSYSDYAATKSAPAVSNRELEHAQRQENKSFGGRQPVTRSPRQNNYYQNSPAGPAAPLPQAGAKEQARYADEPQAPPAAEPAYDDSTVVSDDADELSAPTDSEQELAAAGAPAEYDSNALLGQVDGRLHAPKPKSLARDSDLAKAYADKFAEGVLADGKKSDSGEYAKSKDALNELALQDTLSGTEEAKNAKSGAVRQGALNQPGKFREQEKRAAEKQTVVTGMDPSSAAVAGKSESLMLSERARRDEAPESQEERALDALRSKISPDTFKRKLALGGAGGGGVAAGDEFHSLNNLVFQEATGYWSNTYIPGDPAVRRLQTALLHADTAQLEALTGKKLSLHDAARQLLQPFDVPENSSLGLQLHSDRTGLEGPGRMLVQVGIQGTDRNSGRRPALNLAVIVNAGRGADQQANEQIRELVAAFNELKDIGDRFRLYFTGTDDCVTAENFRHGPLSILMDKSLSNRTIAPQRTLSATYREALDAVRVDDNPNAPLGSSAVIIITADRVSAELAGLTRMAHQSAVGGVQTSVFGIGANVEERELDQLALAGQGSRRMLAPGSNSKETVTKELLSASRAVAKAVRLRIRLAPGVKLVNVLGSYRLDTEKAQAVREAEKSIDQRISRNLGIAADRGEDEEGIQIVIPTFYAGDSHVILLDVVAPGAGAIADVRIRYKDLVYLKNAVATANLSVSRTVSQLGPLEQNVLKNFLAFRLSEALQQASANVSSGDPAQAVQPLENYIQLVSELSRYDSGISADRDVAHDALIVRDYQSAIMAGGTANQTDMIAKSLAYAGKRKVLPPDYQELK